MAVSRRPNGRRGSEALRVIADNLACRAGILCGPLSRFPGVRARGDLGPVVESRYREVAERAGRPPPQLAQAADGDLAQLDVGVLDRAGRHEVPPGPVVAG